MRSRIPDSLLLLRDGGAEGGAEKGNSDEAGTPEPCMKDLPDRFVFKSGSGPSLGGT
eukprot:CAMPEP_0206546470 /NCGR_PEP_ID=MMETSP0325_2-20121206/12730_1 /ASSEMBLY_ACC=CAM_ASM_000347 /TAXON_ID=2866 /ORGANISM="Crypthecodinium cohnii, Strain Seligo" /LENGTH=56 /DNA_ID=CAMNT_0054045611 /DNA_START=13 /DNA_END=183 /DNA_ORIENTATION=-